jgi:type III secretion protein J
VGVLDSLGDSGLIASRQTEHARLVIGTAGELERSLRDVAGVLSARVHLAVPSSDPLTPGAEKAPPSASVLVRHRGTSPPLSPSEVQRLVAGAVSGLEESRVAVVMHPVVSPPREASDTLVQMGPLSVSRSSMVSLRWLIAAAAGLNAVLLGALLFVWSRLRRMRERDVGATSAEGST